MKAREPPSIWPCWNLPSAVTILHDPAARLPHSTLWSLSGRSSTLPPCPCCCLPRPDTTTVLLLAAVTSAQKKTLGKHDAGEIFEAIFLEH